MTSRPPVGLGAEQEETPEWILIRQMIDLHPGASKQYILQAIGEAMSLGSLQYVGLRVGEPLCIERYVRSGEDLPDGVEVVGSMGGATVSSPRKSADVTAPEIDLYAMFRSGDVEYREFDSGDRPDVDLLSALGGANREMLDWGADPRFLLVSPDADIQQYNDALALSKIAIEFSRDVPVDAALLFGGPIGANHHHEMTHAMKLSVRLADPEETHVHATRSPDDREGSRPAEGRQRDGAAGDDPTVDGPPAFFSTPGGR